ncbi:hypothetical protein C2E23DRAFT_438684 [Lenzites betulinus]|nr:hypothetical protein C2E23DRAFT_438684 [Lenzites betulinus]
MDGKTTLVSPADFLREFVPTPKNLIMPTAFSTILGSVPKATNELDIHEPLMTALNGEDSEGTQLCPEFTFVATPSRGDKNATSNQAVDCGMYPSTHAPDVEYGKDGKKLSPAVDWSSIAVPIEVKSTKTKDPFDDSNPDAKTSTAEGKEALGQILAYVQSTLDHQHLNFLFMVLIIEEDARLLRVDRSGLFVTKKFNYKTEGKFLMDFFWRFARLSPEERGVDTTAERVSYDMPCAKIMRQKIRHAPKDYTRDLFLQSLDPAWPLWILALTDERTGERRRFFVGKPHFRSEGVAGRGTRGYVALDADNMDKPFVYLKDSWRVVHEEIKKEGAVLERLNKENVLYVPTLMCHGDLGQTTKSQSLWYQYRPGVSPDAPCPLKKHEHYRLVVKEVGRPLTEFRDGYELVKAIACCLEAHARAYALGIIHRDISAGNILLYPSGDDDDLWEGMLNDWELSKDVNNTSPVARQPDRMGTWQFMSAHALNNPEKPIAITDELESFFHVLLYIAIRFLPHNCAERNVGKLLYAYFDDFEDTDTGYACGMAKFSSMRTGFIGFVQDGGEKILTFGWQEGGETVTHPINYIFREILAWLKAHYAIAHPPEESANPTTSKTANASSSSQGARQRPKKTWLGGPVPSLPKAAQSGKASVVSLKERENAKKLLTHDAMGQLLLGYLNGEKAHEWPQDDKVKDQRPKKGYKLGDEIPRVPTAYMNALVTKAVKRDDEDVDDVEPPSTPKRVRVEESK